MLPHGRNASRPASQWKRRLKPSLDCCFSSVGWRRRCVAPRISGRMVRAPSRCFTTSLILSHAAAALTFFDPIARFGSVSEAPLRETPKPLLLVLPGLDGSGITAWTQFPELAREYDVRALKIPSDDRTSYTELISTCAAQISDARAAGREEVLLLGESMGAGIALDVARQEAPSALVLVSPAGMWDKTWLGRLRFRLLKCDDAFLGARGHDDMSTRMHARGSRERCTHARATPHETWRSRLRARLPPRMCALCRPLRGAHSVPALRPRHDGHDGTAHPQRRERADPRHARAHRVRVERR